MHTGTLQQIIEEVKIRELPNKDMKSEQREQRIKAIKTYRQAGTMGTTSLSGDSNIVGYPEMAR